MVNKVVYLDNAAATRLDERVLKAMKSYFFDIYAVATSEFGYSLGLEARDALSLMSFSSHQGALNRAIWH
jgi:cysteine desulfurase